MATAIVRIYTKDGFIIAADGRVRNAVDLSIKTDHMQKIFEFGESPPSLVFSCTGTCQIGAAERAFDLGSAAKTSIQSVSMKRYTTLYAYCERLAKSIQAQLRVALEGSKDLPGERSDREQGYTIAELMVDGYFQAVPSMASIRFYHENKQLANPEVTPIRFGEDAQSFHGVSGLSAKLRADTNSIFARYRKPINPVRGSELLTHAATWANTYIEACSSPEAKILDKRASDGIGGRTHMATITPTGGFEWVPGFEPLIEST